MWEQDRRTKVGLPPIRLHDVRHSYATTALAAGIPAKIVSERLGHANVQITLDTYSHVIPGLVAAVTPGGQSAHQIGRPATQRRTPYFTPDGLQQPRQTQVRTAVRRSSLARRCGVMQDPLTRATSRTAS